jgi:hypothetical protein
MAIIVVVNRLGTKLNGTFQQKLQPTPISNPDSQSLRC